MSRALVALALVSGGCASSRGANPAGARIVDGPPPSVYAASIRALAAHGFDCHVKKAQLVCDDDKPDRATLFVSYARHPTGRARLVFVAFDRLDEPCAELLPELNRFNYEFDFAQVSCRDDEQPMLFYVGNLTLPEYGLTAMDLGSYATWWSSGVTTAVRATNLMRGRRPARRGAPGMRQPAEAQPPDPTERKL